MKYDIWEIIWASIICVFVVYGLHSALFLREFQIVSIFGISAFAIMALITGWVVIDGIITLIIDYFKGKWK